MEEDYRDLAKNIAVTRVPSYYTERILAQKSEAQTTLQTILPMATNRFSSSKYNKNQHNYTSPIPKSLLSRRRL